MNLNYFDISPALSSETAVFPGDTPFSKKTVCNFEEQTPYLVSCIQSTVHIGAHTDAPNHYHKDGASIDERPLDYYLGTAQVLSVNLKPESRITPKDIEGVEILAERILFKTNSFPNPNRWNADFNALSPELITYLAKKNVKLVGIDTPSVDLANDTELKTHHAIYKHDLAILEGILLNHVPDGIYTLIALPLKIKGADASPVRAILLKDDG